MSELNDNNPGGSEQIPENGADLIAEDAVPLCLHCLRPCNPLDYYCSCCDSNDTVNPLAAYMPFVQIRFNYGFFGKVWRGIWYGKETIPILKILYLFFLAVYVPLLLIVGLPVLLIYKSEKPELSKQEKLLFYFLAALLIILYGLGFCISFASHLYYF